MKSRKASLPRCKARGNFALRLNPPRRTEVMARRKSANPKPTKRSKTSAAQSEENLTVTNGAIEEAVQKKGPQLVEYLSQTQATRPTSQPAPNRSRSKNGASSITEEQIRERAYQLFLERGRQHGRHEDDWYRAESELRGYTR